MLVSRLRSTLSRSGQRHPRRKRQQCARDRRQLHKLSQGRCQTQRRPTPARSEGKLNLDREDAPEAQAKERGHQALNMRLEKHVGDEENNPAALRSDRSNLEGIWGHAKRGDAGVVDQRCHVSTALLRRVGRVEAACVSVRAEYRKSPREEEKEGKTGGHQCTEYTDLREWVGSVGMAGYLSPGAGPPRPQ